MNRIITIKIPGSFSTTTFGSLTLTFKEIVKRLHIMKTKVNFLVNVLKIFN